MDCKRCGECCRYLAFRMDGMSPKELNFLTTRGIFVYPDPEGVFYVVFQHDCIMLDGDLCRLHEGAKPEVCRKAECLLGQSWFEEARKYYAYH